MQSSNWALPHSSLGICYVPFLSQSLRAGRPLTSLLFWIYICIEGTHLWGWPCAIEHRRVSVWIAGCGVIGLHCLWDMEGCLCRGRHPVHQGGPVGHRVCECLSSCPHFSKKEAWWSLLKPMLFSYSAVLALYPYKCIPRMGNFLMVIFHPVSRVIPTFFFS